MLVLVRVGVLDVPSEDRLRKPSSTSIIICIASTSDHRDMAVIRERLTSDLDDCVEALRAVYADSGYPVEGVANPTAIISGSDTIQAWVAEYNGRVVGHVAMTMARSSAQDVVLWRDQGHNEDIAALGRLFVHPEAQGLGIAAKLMETAVNHAATQSSRLLLFSLEKDIIARRLYEKLGWTFYGNFEYQWNGGMSMNAYCFVSPALT